MTKEEFEKIKIIVNNMEMHLVVPDGIFHPLETVEKDRLFEVLETFIGPESER